MIDTIKVGGVTYHISEATQEELGEGVTGKVDNYASEIKVLKDLLPQARRQALWRLIMPIIANNAGLDLSANELAALGNGAYTVMVDNLGFR